MVRLPLPMTILRVLVALAAKVMLVLPPPGILDNPEFLSAVLALENKEEREMFEFVGPLACKMFPLLGVPNHQESRLLKGVELMEVRMLPKRRAVEVPLKIQRVWLVGLSWLG